MTTTMETVAQWCALPLPCHLPALPTSGADFSGLLLQSSTIKIKTLCERQSDAICEDTILTLWFLGQSARPSPSEPSESGPLIITIYRRTYNQSPDNFDIESIKCGGWARQVNFPLFQLSSLLFLNTCVWTACHRPQLCLTHKAPGSLEFTGRHLTVTEINLKLSV